MLPRKLDFYVDGSLTYIPDTNFMEDSFNYVAMTGITDKLESLS